MNPQEKLRERADQVAKDIGAIYGFDPLLKALLETRNEAIELAAIACDVDWPLGIKADKVKYEVAATLKDRILSLKTGEGK